jgi:hypothetical protein
MSVALRASSIGVTNGSVQEIRHSCVHPAAGQVAILSHRDPGVPEVIGTDPGRQPIVVDQR